MGFETPGSARLLFRLIDLANTSAGLDFNLQTSDLMTLMAESGVSAVRRDDIVGAMESIVHAGYAISTATGDYQLRRMPLLFMRDVLHTVIRPIHERPDAVLERLSRVLADPASRGLLERLANSESILIERLPSESTATINRLVDCHLIESASGSSDVVALKIADGQRPNVLALLQLVPPGMWHDTFTSIKAAAGVVAALLLGRRDRQAIHAQFVERLGVDVASTYTAALHTPPVEAVPDYLLQFANTRPMLDQAEVTSEVAELMRRLEGLAQTVYEMQRAAGYRTEEPIRLAAQWLGEAGLAHTVDIAPRLGLPGQRLAYFLTPWGAGVGRALEEMVTTEVHRLARDSDEKILPVLGSPEHLGVLAAIDMTTDDAGIAKLAHLLGISDDKGDADRRIRKIVAELIDAGLAQRPTDTRKKTGAIETPVASLTGLAVIRASGVYDDLMEMEMAGPTGTPRWHRALERLWKGSPAEKDIPLGSLTSAMADIKPSESQIDAEIHRVLTDDKDVRRLVIALGKRQAAGEAEVQLLDRAAELGSNLQAVGVNIRTLDGAVFASLPVMPTGNGKIGDLLSLVVPGTPENPTELTDALAGFTPEIVAILRYLCNCGGVQNETRMMGLQSRTWPRKDEIPAVRQLAERYVAEPVQTARRIRRTAAARLFKDACDYWGKNNGSADEIAEAMGLSSQLVEQHLAIAERLGLGRFKTVDLPTMSVKQFIFEPWVLFLRGAMEQLATNAVELTRGHIADAFLPHLTDATDARLITEIMRGSFSIWPVTAASLAVSGIHMAGGDLLDANSILNRLRAMSRHGVVDLLDCGLVGSEVRVPTAVQEVLAIGRRHFREMQLDRRSNDIQ